MYISILATLLLELSLNLKKCIRIFERSEKILMLFFEFKVDSNNRVASIEIYTTYESRTSKMQQEQVIQSDCRNTNTNFNHDISPYHNSNPRYNIGISRCKGTGPFLSPYEFLPPPPPL